MKTRCVHKLRWNILGACLAVVAILNVPVFCLSQGNEETLRDHFHNKQRAAEAADECQRLIEAEAFREAQELCHHAVEFRPQDLRSAWNLGLSLLHGGKLDEAKPYFDTLRMWRVEHRDPMEEIEEVDRAFAALFERIDTLTQQGQFLDAARYAREWLQRLERSYDVESLLRTARGSLEDSRKIERVELYQQALRFYQEAFDAEGQSLIPRRAVLQEALKGLGESAGLLGRNAQAIDYDEQALEFALERGDRGAEANIRATLGELYLIAGRYQDSIDACLAAADYFRSNEQVFAAFLCLDRIGAAYRALAQYDRAIVYYQKALNLAETNDDTEDVIVASNNLGTLYETWGLYNKALEFYQHALEAEQRLQEDTHFVQRDQLAFHYRAIGQVYERQQEYQNALAAYEQALSYSQGMSHVDIAVSLEQLGHVYSALGRDEEAREQFGLAIAYWEGYQRDLEGSKQGPDDHRYDAHIAAAFNNIGALHLWLESYDKAHDAYRKALAINQRAGLRVEMATNIWNIAECSRREDNFEDTVEQYTKALELFRETDRKDEEGILLHSLGTLYFEAGSYSDAIPSLKASVEISEELRNTAAPEARREYFATLIDTYRYLISAYLRVGDLENAFQIIELSRAKQLSEQLKQENSAGTAIPTLAQLQQAMPQESAMVLYARGAEEHLIRVLLTHEKTSVIERPLADFMTSLPAATAKDRSIHTEGSGSRGLGIVGAPETEIPPEPQPLDYREPGTFRELVRAYRDLLQDPGSTASLTPLARHFYELLLADVEDVLRGKTTLLILPEGEFNFLPFETLVDRDGRWLAEVFHIRYAHSNAVLASIGQRRYSAGRPLLAFGGAVYDAPDYQDDLAGNAPRVALLQQQIDSALQRHLTRALYADLGKAVWNNLPGTLAEVNALGEMFDDAVIFSGADVNEGHIKSLSESGKLAGYRMIHFATHGEANLLIPELSALVLSLPQELEGDDDGFLRAGEIVDLQLQADLVTLSACETGLGKFYDGEGIVGLSQAFLLAGANSVSVSLWQVADESTALFMPAVYRLLQEKNMSSAEAFSEVKRLFIRGAFGDDWKAPYYWAPFVYYGQ